MNIYIILLILLFIYLAILPTKTKFTQITQPIKMYIFSKKDCSACIYYKKYTHEKIVKELKELYINLKIEISENEEMFKKYNIKYFPTIAIEKDVNKIRKLPMNKQITTENIIQIINA
jgi:hypothetical protein